MLTPNRTRRPLRLALVITELEVGGAEKSLVELALGLSQRSFAPQVISLAPRPAGPRADLARRLEAAGLPVHYVGVTRPWQAMVAVRRLTALLREQRPDVLQTFLYHANVIGALAARRAGVRHVVSGIRQHEPSAWRRWVERRYTAGNDAFVCVSRSVADACRQLGHLPPQRLETIANGIDVTAYDAVRPANRASQNLPASRQVVLFAGRLEKQKGADLLIKAWRRAAPRLPEFSLLIAGEGPQQRQLEKFVERTHLSHQTHFLGWRPDIPALLADSELLVLPSLWEGMPNIVLEAMASGLAVLATDVEGVRELLGDDDGGQIVPPGDSKALAERLVELAGDTGRRQELGRRNRKRAATQFSRDGMIEAYAAIYKRLAAS